MNPMDGSNEELLARYQKGEFAAFDAFYRRTHQSVFYFLLKKAGQRELAEDMLQETYYRIHKHILNYDPGRNAMNWVLTIAANCLRSALRRQQEVPDPTDQPDQGAPTAEARVAWRQEIATLLGSLEPGDQELLLERLVRAEGRTMLIATHSAGVADRADRRLELHDGELIR